jgi:hypothetical protein
LNPQVPNVAQEIKVSLRYQRKPLTRDGILGHHFDKRHQYFAPCYSQSLLLADFKENPFLFSDLKILTKKSAKQENSSLFMNRIF